MLFPPFFHQSPWVAPVLAATWMAALCAIAMLLSGGVREDQ